VLSDKKKNAMSQIMGVLGNLAKMNTAKAHDANPAATSNPVAMRPQVSAGSVAPWCRHSPVNSATRLDAPAMITTIEKAKMITNNARTIHLTIAAAF